VTRLIIYAILDIFEQKAEKSQVVNVLEIKKTHEEALGCSLNDDKSQIYRVFKRHGWCKVIPRSKYPNKASDETIDVSKKPTNLSETQWQKMT